MEDPGEETPSAHRGIPLRLGSVDAVSGEINLRVPLGPKMPGRLPIGFCYCYDSQNSYQMQMGGDFRPVVWPSTDVQRLMYTVTVNGTHYNFARNFEVPNLVNPLAVMSAYSIDDGEQAANNYAIAYSTPGITLTVGAFVPHVYQSMDGKSFFVTSAWKIVVLGGDPSQSNVLEGQRMMVITGGSVIWTDCLGTSHFQTVSGDHVVVKETTMTVSPLFDLNQSYAGGSIQIYSANDSSQQITMNVTSTTISVNNSFGLPSVSLSGGCRCRQRWNRDTGQLGTLYDFGFVIRSMVTTAGSQSTTTSFNWSTGFNPPLTSISHPNGLTETFTFGATRNYHGLADYAFDPNTGQWLGFSPNPSCDIYFTIEPMVTQIVRQSGSVGSCIQIQQTTPAWVVGASSGVTWQQTAHTTLVMTYPTPTPTGGWRGIRLTHPSYTYGGSGANPTWGGPQASPAEVTAAYLFATSAVLMAEFLDTSGNVYKTVQSDDWSLRSYYNPAGTVLFSNPQTGVGSVSIPLNPSPTLLTITVPGLPTQVKSASQWDQFGYQTSILSNTSPGGATVQSEEDRTWHLSPNFNVLVTEDDQTLEGGALATLREGAGSSVSVRQTSTSFDGLDRPATISTVSGTITMTESRAYSGLNPNPDETTQTSSAGFQFSGQMGKSYTYGPGPQYWLLTEKDNLSGQVTTHEPDWVMGWDNAVTDPYGIRTTFAHDAWGRLSQKTRLAKGAVDALTTLETYDPNGLWSTETVTGGGNTLITTTTYDAFGRVIKVVKPDGSWQATTYNGWEDRVSQTPWIQAGQSNYGSFTWTYDGKGRVLSETDPKGRILMRAPQDPAWDSTQAGIVSTTLDDRGFSKSVVWDLLGQKKAVIDQNAQQAMFAYDAFGHMISNTFNGQVRSYTYNELGWMTSRNEPEEGSTTFAGFTMLGQAGFVCKYGLTGQAPITITTGRDSLGRICQVSDGGGLLRQITYDPTFTDQVSTLTETQPNGLLTEAYQYDGLGRRSSKLVTDGNQAFAISQVLDAFGNVTSLTYPAGGGKAPRTVTYGFDAYLRPSTLTLGTQRGAMSYVGAGTTFTKTLTFGNGASTIWTTASGDLAQVQHNLGATPLENSMMTWTAGGLLETRGNDTFTYDGLGRLTGAQVNGLLPGEIMAQAFGYDASGNRTSSSSVITGAPLPDEALTWNATYPGTNGLPAQVANLSTGVTYDDFGRMLNVWAIPGQSSTFTSWTYDSLGRVVSEGGTQFLLDGQGLRFRRTHADGSIWYVVYGFNREGLSTFRTGPVATTSSTSQAKRAAMQAAVQAQTKSQTVLATSP